MNSDPELDRLVAEKVMGWTVESQHGENLTAYNNGRLVCRSEVRDDKRRIDFTPFTDIAHAWEVVEKMHGYKFILEKSPYYEGYCYVTFTQEGRSDAGTRLRGEANEPTAQRAICVAALMAMWCTL